MPLRHDAFARADRVNEKSNRIEPELSAMQRQIQRLQSDVRSFGPG
jgi:hypothetical protein